MATYILSLARDISRLLYPMRSCDDRAQDKHVNKGICSGKEANKNQLVLLHTN